MNILIFTWKDLGIPDVCDALEKLGCTYRCVSNEYLRERVSPEFDKLFEEIYDEGHYDGVFTFNFSPVLSNNCNKRNVPYIAFVYDSIRNLRRRRFRRCAMHRWPWGRSGLPNGLGI